MPGFDAPSSFSSSSSSSFYTTKLYKVATLASPSTFGLLLLRYLSVKRSTGGWKNFSGGVDK